MKWEVMVVLVVYTWVVLSPTEICRYEGGLLFEMRQKLFCPKTKSIIVMRVEVCE